MIDSASSAVARCCWALLSAALTVQTACAGNSAGPVIADSSIRGVFEGITPCSPRTRPLPQIPASTDCEQMIWKIVLREDSATGSPTTYSLNTAYGLSQQNSTGLAGGVTAIAMQGKWDIAKGTKEDSGAVVYRLFTDETLPAVSFLRLTDGLLHVLTADRTLMVGNGAWSYTLNRTDNQPSHSRRPSGSPPEPPPRPPIPPAPAGSTVLGVFDGRLPCHPIVLEITRTAPYPGCMKVKSRLTLYQGATTGEPTSYLYMGVSTFREGAWTIVRGTTFDPGATVYQLHLHASDQTMSFLRVDENHLFLMDGAGNLLVGNALFSYTLSRSDEETR